MFMIRDILKDRYVSNISRWQGSPMVTLKSKEEAQQYYTHDEAKQIIKTKLCTSFEVVTL